MQRKEKIYNLNQNVCSDIFNNRIEQMLRAAPIERISNFFESLNVKTDNATQKKLSLGLKSCMSW